MVRATAPCTTTAGGRADCPIASVQRILVVGTNAPDSAAVAERLAAERGVVSLPGGVFGPGGERHLRLAFANTDEGAIAEVPRRLAGLLAPVPVRSARDERPLALAVAPGRPLDRPL